MFLEGLDLGLTLLDPPGAIPAGRGLHEADHILQLCDGLVLAKEELLPVLGGLGRGIVVGGGADEEVVVGVVVGVGVVFLEVGPVLHPHLYY